MIASFRSFDYYEDIVSELEKSQKDLEDLFRGIGAEDAGGLTPGKDDNAAPRKTDRKHEIIFKFGDYKSQRKGVTVLNLPISLISQLETPCIVIDVEQTQKNILKMQQAANQSNCKLRPHIKTHKMTFFTRMQLEAGASGITCAKISEAEVMAEGGAADIFIAYPMVGDFRVRRAVALAKRIKRLILAVDSLASAEALNRAAMQENIRLEVRLELDTGLKRTGTPRGGSVELAQQIAAMPGLKLSGIYTFKSLIYKDQPTEDISLAAEEEGEIMRSYADQMEAAGIHDIEVSAGSTPTGIALAQTGKVDEIRPGTYVFNDEMICREGVATREAVSVRIYATVVSTPEPGYAVIDGGVKTFPMDVPLNTAPYYYPGYAIVEGHEHLLLRRMNEEHGILTAENGETGLTVGQKLALIPLHVCPAINMHNQVYLYENGMLRQEPVQARGMLV